MTKRASTLDTSQSKVAIVMEPIAAIKPQKDTTLAMMRSAQEMGAQLFYLTQGDLYCKTGKAFGVATPVKVLDNPDQWFILGDPVDVALCDFDAILMRVPPPVDKRFIHSCYMLEQAQRDGARVVNNPAALIGWNEKLLAGQFPQYCPATIVSSSRAVLRTFLDEEATIIIKPLDGMGGQGVFMVSRNDVNFDVIWEVHTDRGAYPVMAQAFVPAISQGDARVFVIAGKPFDKALVRVPKQGSVRGNLAAGGSFKVRDLTPREREIAEAVGEMLVAEGVVFAGLDVIGDYLIEVNITSPTGLVEVSKACDIGLVQMVVKNMLGGI